MTALVKKSDLNPLATSFIPSGWKPFCENKTMHEKVKTVQVMKTVSKKLNIGENSNVLETKKAFHRSSTGTDILCRKKVVVEETKENSKAVVLFKLPHAIPRIPYKAEVGEIHLNGLEVFGISPIFLLFLLNVIHRQVNERDKSSVAVVKTDETEVECLSSPMIDWVLPPTFFGNPLNIIHRQINKRAESSVAVFETAEEIEVGCRCPRMFGLVLPPTLLGNPLNLNYTCSLNYVHVAQYNGDSPEDTKYQPIVNLSKEVGLESRNELKESNTLEEFSFELEKIIKDVCNCIRDDDSPLECEEKSKDYFEVSAIESDDESDDESNEQENSVWNVDEILDKEDKIADDDGSHPLLLPLPSRKKLNEDEEIRESLGAVEKILEICLSPSLESRTFDFEERKAKPICNPPCSVWCEYLPSAAKETFTKFLKQSGKAGCTRETGAELNHLLRKPMYKRSFSVDDSKIYTLLSEDLKSFTSGAESRDRLMLLRKDPMAYFENNSITSKNGKRKCVSSYPNIFDCQLNKSSSAQGDDSNMWGLFDGADSLWRPLPDCVPSVEQCQKQSSLKKMREMRRQQSVK